MADTASTTFPKSSPIPERSTRRYSATLTDPEGEAIQPASVSSIRFTLKVDNSDEVVNGRNRVEVLNQNGGTMAADGAFAMVLDTDDTRAIGSSKLQKRRMLFEVFYADGVENHEVFFYVENLEDVPEDVDAQIGALAFAGRLPTVVVV